MDAAKLKEAIRWARLSGYPTDKFGILADAAEAHLATLPKTKEIYVWHIEYVIMPNLPAINVFLSHADAERFAAGFKNPTAQCVRVTGPHKQTVPA